MEKSEPTCIGRFTRLRPLGRGGMGLVYAAYDESLDRQVAIKLLRTDAGPRHAEHRTRMEREATLLARLSHPNVVTIHEVGEHDGQLFIAMELVRGVPLDAWLERHRAAGHGTADWRAALAVVVQAGAGLVAAHQAGLVHRDFKPGNVMVGEDGIVKVLDFGLARDGMLEQTLRSSYEAQGRERASEVASGGSLTWTDTLLGAPAYMPPEQHLGHGADERSDQFSFCVVLFEALYGLRPFDGTTLVALQDAVLAGQVREVPRRTSVPRRIRRLLLRGLAVRPEDRHPSLAELLRALEHDPSRVWRWRAAVGGLLLLASTGSFALATREDDDAVGPCAEVEDELAAVWNDERRADVEGAIRATGVSYADETWQRVEPRLDEYANAWMAMRAESCQAYADGLEPAQHHDLRTTCLARRRAAMDTLVSLLSAATGEDVAQATLAAEKLPPLETCADLDVLTAALPPPEDPVVAQAVEAHRVTLARAREHERLGRFDEARGLIAPVLASAEAKAYAPLEAEALLHLGSVEEKAMRFPTATEVLSQALEASLRIGHLEVATEAIARRIFAMGPIGRGEEALQDVPLAQALVERSDDDHLRRLLINIVGTIHHATYRLDEAEEHFRAALALTARMEGTNHVQYALILDNLANLALRRGNCRVAANYALQSFSIVERVLGREHPRVIKMTNSVVSVGFECGRSTASYERLTAIDASDMTPMVPLLLAIISNERESFAEALDYTTQALALSGEFTGMVDLTPLWVTRQRAIALEGLELHAEAMAELEKVSSVAEGIQDRPDLAGSIHETRGQILLAHGDVHGALAAYRLALSLEEKGVHDVYGQAFCQLGFARALHALGDLEGALDAATRGFEQFTAEASLCSKTNASFRQVIGDILFDMGRIEDALAQYELGHHEFAETADPDHPTLAELELAMARALPKTERDRAEALARSALASFRRYAPGFADEAAAAEQLLREELQVSAESP